MSEARLETIDRVVRRGITAGGYPGASVVVGRRGYAVWQKGFGTLAWGAGSPAVDPQRTVYDLASLTKVVGLTTAAMILYDEGRLQLDARVVDILPAFTGGAKDQVTVRDLLTHRSGLPAGRELWRIARTPEEARQKVLETPLTGRPGVTYVYSDLGADVLGMIVEEISGQPLDRFVRERIFQPLGMFDTGFLPHDSLRSRTAPTEVTPPRGYPLRGEVHDENAWALGGVAGHAGLFGTASDLSIFAQMLLNGGTYNGVRIVSENTIRLFTARAAGSRALGWEVAAGEHGAGDFLSPSAFGHTGFTGTSLWIDPEREMFVLLLTNRVHAAKARRPARIIADVRNDLADAATLAVTDEPLLRQVAFPSAFRADRAVGWNRPVQSRTAGRRPSASRTTVKKSTTTSKKKPVAKSSTAGKKSSTTAKKPSAAVKKSSASGKAPVDEKATTKKATTTQKPTTVKKSS